MGIYKAGTTNKKFMGIYNKLGEFLINRKIFKNVWLFVMWKRVI